MVKKFEDGRKTNTKEDILRSSLDLFAQFGFHGTSMREIAESVGIRKSSIYNHFSGKDDIFEELFEKLAPVDFENEIKWEDIKNKRENPRQIIQNLAQKLVHEMEDEEHLKLLHIMLREHNDQFVQAHLVARVNHNLKMAADFMQILIENKIIENRDTELLAQEMIGPIFMLRMQYLIEPQQKSIENLYQRVADHIDFFLDKITIANKDC